MEVPYIQGASNPLKKDEAEAERFAEDFAELQKKISDADEKERSRKRHRQEELEEMKRKSTSTVQEQRAAAPSPLHDAGFTKVMKKKPVAGITPPSTPSSGKAPKVSETAESQIQFEATEQTLPTSPESPRQVPSLPPLAKEPEIAPLPEVSKGEAAPLEKAHPPAEKHLVGKELLEESPQEFEQKLEETLNTAPLLEEKLGKAGEVEQSLFTPDKNLSTISSLTQSTAPSPYTRLTPEMMEMFDNMILHMQVMEQSDIRETTFTLGGKAFEGSDLYGSKIIIREYQKSAPMQYNIEFEGSPEAVEKLSKKLDALTLAFTHGNYAFKVHRFETRISTKSFKSEKGHFDREELT